MISRNQSLVTVRGSKQHITRSGTWTYLSRQEWSSSVVFLNLVILTFVFIVSLWIVSLKMSLYFPSMSTSCLIIGHWKLISWLSKCVLHNGQKVTICYKNIQMNSRFARSRQTFSANMGFKTICKEYCRLMYFFSAPHFTFMVLKRSAKPHSFYVTIRLKNDPPSLKICAVQTCF